MNKTAKYEASKKTKEELLELKKREKEVLLDRAKICQETIDTLKDGLKQA